MFLYIKFKQKESSMKSKMKIQNRNIIMNRLLKAWIVGLSLSFILVPSVMARHGMHSGEAIQILNKVSEILIANGYCENTRDCIMKEYGFTDADDNGIGASFYKINDIKTINQIISLYTSAYFRYKQNIDIEVTFDRYSHAEDRWYKKSYIQLKYKGVEK